MARYTTATTTQKSVNMYFKISTVFTTALLLLTEITSAAPAVSADQANVLEARALTSDQQMALNVHNSARSSKRVPALQWDASLASAAQSYANTLASTGQFKHSGVGGENLFYERGGTYPQPLLDASKAWIAEKPNYHNEVIPQGNFEAYGHYSMRSPEPATIVFLELCRLTSCSRSSMCLEGYH